MIWRMKSNESSSCARDQAEKGVVCSRLRFALGEFKFESKLNTTDLMNFIQYAGIDEHTMSYVNAINFCSS